MSGLDGMTVLAFESRRERELATLIERHGGVAIVVPALREVPLDSGPALELVGRLERSEIDVVVMTTGVGVRTLARAVAASCPAEHLASLLRGTTVVARGPKPAAALRELGVDPQIVVGEPNTWHEVLAAVDADVPVAGRRVAVQEYGRRNAELLDALEARGAETVPVPVYGWALPEDPHPLQDAIGKLATEPERFPFLLFTSQAQVEHVMLAAEELGLREQVVGAAARAVVGSVGPVCSASLRKHGLPVDVEPSHPKMGSLVVALARRGPSLLAAKRRGSPPA